MSMKIKAGMSTKLLLVLGLVAAFSSTSFAAKAEKVPEAVSKNNQSGQKTNNLGGGETGKKKSCLPGAQKLGLKGESAGFKAGQLEVNMTDRGFELSLCGNTKIATDPSAANPNPATAGAAGNAQDKKFGFCIVNPELAKNERKDPPTNFICESFTAKVNQQGQEEPVKFNIMCEDKKMEAQVKYTKDAQGKVTDAKIIIRSSDRDKDTNYLEVHAAFTEAGQDKVKGKVTVAEKPNSGAKPDAEAGTLHFPLEGDLETKPDPNDKDDEGQKFKTCQVESDGKGPKNENETAKPVDIPLAGSCIVYRGAMVPMISESYAGCRTSNSDTNNISMMQDRKPKGQQ